MKTEVKDYPYLSQLEPTDGAFALPYCDSVQLLWANLLAGLTSFTKQDSVMTYVDDQAYSAFAAPYCDIHIADGDARADELFTDLLKKIESFSLADDCSLVLTGEWSEYLVESLCRRLSLEPSKVIAHYSMLETIEHWEQQAKNSDQQSWLWIAFHTGCSERTLRRNRPELACSERSEGIYSTDCASALLLQRTSSPSYRLCSALEFANEDPLQQEPSALKQLAEGFEQGDERRLLHAMPVCAASEIELYKFKQKPNIESANSQDNGDQIESETAEAWSMLTEQNQSAIATAASIGSLGVCTLPLQLWLQHHWSGNESLLAIACERDERILWSRLSKLHAQEGT